ncbi:TniQ family protein [Pelagibacterium mangrovi]|uniref:TniQ family protein n=1 Tax=Pelagibacterium mangrovi TaxID=3119828 RepID=UPI002FCAD1AF
MTPRQRNPSVIIEPMAFESARSYAIRACMENGWPRQRDFLKRVGLTGPRLLARSQPDEVAAALGLRQDELATLPGIWTKHDVDFSGHRIQLTKTSKFHRRVCKHCLASMPAAPFEWELDFISDCPEHGPLVSQCDCGQPLTWNDRHLASCDRCPAEDVIASPTITPEPKDLPCQLYLLGRLGRRERITCSILDPLPVDLVVDVVRAIGALLAKGFATKHPLPESELELVEWAEAGFGWLRCDDLSANIPTGIVEAFRRTQGILCPREPIRALGFIADLVALHLDEGKVLSSLLARRLGKALGYPVTDIWRTDYRDIDFCLASSGLNKTEFFQILVERNWLSRCRDCNGAFFVPVDTLWEVGCIARASKTRRPSSR